MIAKPIGWMTHEALDRLKRGGNESRGTVPVHVCETGQASIPLYSEADYAELVAELDAIKDELDEAEEMATDYNTALKLLIMRAFDMNMARAVYELHGVTEKKILMGSWRITVEAMEGGNDR